MDFSTLFGIRNSSVVRISLNQCWPHEGASSRKHQVLSWTDERTKVLADIRKLEPTDRLSLYSGLIKVNSALFESVRGWDSWLRNPTFMETFSQDELGEIFKNFKDVATKFLEEDIRWTGKKEQGRKIPRAEREEADRRYA
jgi:hypothetical protein